MDEMTTLQTMTTIFGVGSSFVTVIGAIVQIRFLGFKGWLKMGAGLGTEVHEARDKLLHAAEEAAEDL